jgi:transcriptional regulator with XRE-family HTH domain
MTGVSPAVARRRLRLALRRDREAANLTQGEVAKALDWSISKVNRIETGEVTISNTDLQALLRLLDVTGAGVAERYTADARAARDRSGWWDEARYRDHLTPSTLQVVQFERDAVAIRTFQNVLVPGLVQTADYAWSVIGAVDDEMTPETKQIRHDARMRRQREMAARASPPLFLVALDEFIPMRTIGSPQVMVDQLGTVLKLAERPNFHVRILPQDRASFSLIGAFTIFDLEGDPNALLYREGGVTDETTYSADEIARHRGRFEQIWQVSLSEEATFNAIEAQYAQMRANISRGR